MLVAATDPATETIHKVKEGETLAGIANRANVPLIVIAEANGLTDPYVVKLGQMLKIPRQRIHVVKQGDTGFAIAYRYGVPFKQIALANNLPDDGTVKTGQKLIIPAVFDAPAPSSNSSKTPRKPHFRLPATGNVLLSWQRRADGGGHDGIDFAVNKGDMIPAAASGTVIFAGNEPKRFGKLVVIDHGNGWQTAYGHLMQVTVTKGNTVKSGERIGLGGQSGMATRPELHFEIRRNGTPVDPTMELGLKAGG
nr:M23 family metallopeptidase [Altericroceibacterium indicum]